MHLNPITHAAQIADAADRSSQRQGALFDAMKQTVLDAIHQGRDEMLPSCSDRIPRPEGRRVSEWLSSCDAEQEQLLFKLMHLALNRDNLEAIHEAAEKLAVYVAEDFAGLYVEARGDE